MNLKHKLAQLGPGLLYAGAAIGVSHLVQSTRAGAEFGFRLLAVVILVNVVKYPVFEIGPRYAAATGTTLLDGYRKIGNWAVGIYVVMSVLTMFIIMAAISIVTSGLFAQLTGFAVDARFLAVLLLLISALVLGIGKYSVLDKLMKVIVLLLTVSTLLALAFSLAEPSVQHEEYMGHFSFSRPEHVFFLVALIGWMPAPVDITIWYSLWSVSKNKEQGQKIPMKNALADFNLGYWGTTFLAAVFLALGALVMYGTGQDVATGSVEFSGQLINMYTQNLGQWAYPFIALAAFTTMFSTMLTCLDAFPRTLQKATRLMTAGPGVSSGHQRGYWSWMVLTCAGTALILLFFLSSMRSMVDLATTISFVLAPVFATLNFIAMNHRDIPVQDRQPKWLSLANIASIALLTAFSLWFLLY